MRINRENIITNILLLALFFAGLIARGSDYFSTQHGLPALLFISLCVVWTLACRKQIIHTTIRRLLCLQGYFLILLFFIQILKYNMAKSTPDLNRFLNYSYQIPIAIIPLLIFFSALCLGKSERQNPFKNWLWLIVPYALLVGAFLTNDLHNAVYTATGRPVGIYYLAYLWQLLLLVAAFFVTVWRCTLTHMRKFAVVPLAFLLGGLFLFILYVLGGGHAMELGFIKIQFHEIYLLMAIGFWQSCISFSLVPSNSNYDNIFEISSINAQIADDNDEVFLRSSEAEALSKENMNRAKKSEFMLDKNMRLHSDKINGGYVYWTEDLTEINKINSELRDTARQLGEENVILQSENELKEENARLETRNKMYDAVAVKLGARLDEIDRLVDSGDFERAAVLGAYVKRWANLYIIVQENGYILLSDLYLSMKESLDYLTLSGVQCSVAIEGETELDAQSAMNAYEFFEHKIENNVFSKVFVTLTDKNMEMMIDGRTVDFVFGI